jgi:DNA modification methylase
VLRSHWEKLVARDAHLIFWFSLNFHREAEDFFNHSVRDELGIKLYVDPFYLMWFKSDNKGMMHDAKHKPRRVYETAFLITVGDQHLSRPGSNVYAGPTAADKHPSAKPLSAVRHFLRMVVDNTTRLLDPTCGHGSAISAAIELGARAAYGIELDPTHVARARLEIGQTERRFLAEQEVTF